MTNACILYKIDNLSKKIFLLPGNQVEFGRDKSNDIKLALYPLEEISFQWATTDISRKHFTICRQENGQYVVKDASSTNGTSIDCVAILNNEKDIINEQCIDVGGVLELKANIQNNNMLLKRTTNRPEEEYFLFDKEFTLGTSPDSDIYVGKEVRNQVKINYENNAYFITPADENSQIYVNETLIEYNKKTPLYQEAKITISNNTIFFEIILEKRNNL